MPFWTVSILTSEEDSGRQDPKLWVASQIEAKVLEFCKRLEERPEEVTLLELRMFTSEMFVGEAESDAFQRHITNLRTHPYQDYKDIGPDGKMHRYRIDWSFRNPAVRDVYYTTLFNELRKKGLKMDSISSLAFTIGSFRKGGKEATAVERPKRY